jgi:phage shock protein A
MDMALSNVDQQRFEIEKEAEKLQANELLKQFKVEMGMVSPQAGGGAPEKTIGGREGEKTL